MSPVAHLQHGRCPDCGKWRYRSRRGAKTAGRLLYPSTRMYVYRCRGWLHLSSAVVRPSQASRKAAAARRWARRAAA